MTVDLLSHFTPSLVPPEALEATFVQREAVAQRLVELIREGAFTPAKHHTLLTGPRGIGKTHLVSLLFHRLRGMADLEDRLRIAWLTEDEWAIERPLDLYLKILERLADLYPGEATPLQLRGLAVSEAERHAARAIRGALGGRTLLLIVENLDEIFAGLGVPGQQQLRAFCQQDPVVTILATAPSLFPGVALQTSPFYGFFREWALEPLTIDEAGQLLTKVARYRGDRELVDFLDTLQGRARLRAVWHLAGGNHRAYVVLARILTRESLDELASAFLQLLDDLTPYYQSRMKELPLSERKIIEVLCERPEALTEEEIAEACFADLEETKARVLQLARKGYLTQHPGPEPLAELREPLLRMTLSVKRVRGEPIRLLVDALRLWHSAEALKGQLADLPPERSLERTYLEKALAAPGPLPDLIEYCESDLRQYLDAGHTTEARQAAAELAATRGAPGDWVQVGILAHLEADYDEALAAFDRALARAPQDGHLHLLRARTLGALERWSEALAEAECAEAAIPDLTETAFLRAAALIEMGRLEEAVSALDRAHQVGLERELVERLRCVAAFRMGRFDAALAICDHFLNQVPDHVDWHVNRGQVLAGKGMHEEALRCFDRVIALSPDPRRGAFAVAQRARSLWALNRRAEALAGSLRAVDLAPDEPWPWRVRAELLMATAEWIPALKALNRLLRLRPDDLRGSLDRIRVLLQLQRNSEALVACDAILKVSHSVAPAWTGRGIALARTGDFGNALHCFDFAQTQGDRAPLNHFLAAGMCVRLGHLDEACVRVDSLLAQVGDDTPLLEGTVDLIGHVAHLFLDGTRLRAAVRALHGVVATRRRQGLLGVALLQALGPLAGTPDILRPSWEAWRSVGERDPALRLPLRVLGALVRFAETGDARALYRLRTEERVFVGPILPTIIPSSEPERAAKSTAPLKA